MDSTLTIRIPKAMQRELKALSREEHLPLSEVVRKSLRGYLQARKFKAVSRTVRKYAVKQGYLTEDDFFE